MQGIYRIMYKITTGRPRIEWKDKEMMTAINSATNKICKEVAKDIVRDAKTQLKVHKFTGNLARGIKSRKSKFKNGGYIVIAGAPHSFLTEWGTKNRRYSETKEFMVFQQGGKIRKLAIGSSVLEGVKGAKTGFKMKYGRGKGIIGGQWVRKRSVAPMPALKYMAYAVNKNEQTLKDRYEREIVGRFER